MITTTTKPSTLLGVETLMVECHCPLHRRLCSDTSVCRSSQSGEAWVISVICMYFIIVPLCQFVCVHFVAIQRWLGNSVETVT